jgi:hypothetical protein
MLKMLVHIKGFVYAATQAYKSISTGLPNYVHRHRRIDRFGGPSICGHPFGSTHWHPNKSGTSGYLIDLFKLKYTWLTWHKF